MGFVSLLADMFPAHLRVPEESRKWHQDGPLHPGISHQWASLWFTMAFCLLYPQKRHRQHLAQIFQTYYTHLSFSLDYFNLPNHISPHEKRKDKKKKKSTLETDRTRLFKKINGNGCVLLDLWLGR